ncbi:MAG: TonB-dependent receptor, partial [Desulfuromonadales bacterium]|nr:TonB-dependent receptor [Desulfuromonadales bacterium]
NETVRGVDVNINFDKSFQIGERGVNLGVDVVLNHSKEASERFLDDEGNEDFDDDNLEWGFPDWKGQLGLRADVGDWRVTWVANYIGEVIQDVDGVDALSTALVASDTCMGPAYGDVLCRDYGDTDEYVMHSASVYYRSDQWNVGFGVRNVFDTAPPWVDGTEVLAINNTPIGYGYDLNGRTYFLNVRYNLGSN